VSTHPLQEALLLRRWQSTAKNGAIRKFDHDPVTRVVRVQVRWRMISEVNSDRDAEKLANLGHA